MKKLLPVVLATLLVIISACSKEKATTLNDLDLNQYLLAQDLFVVNNQLKGQYSLISVQDDKMEVSFSAENDILKYDTKYNITNRFDGENWSIVTFEKEYDVVEVKNIDPQVVEKLKSYCSSSSVGVFENLKYSISADGYLSFRADFNSLDGTFNSSYTGLIKYNNATISLFNVKETIKDPQDHPIISSDENNILQHYLSLNIFDNIDSIYNVKNEGGYVYAMMKTTNLYRFIAETYDIEVKFSLNGDELTIVEENLINTEIKSRVVGKFVNSDDPQGSYIIFNDDFTFTLYEYNDGNYSILKEFYRIDNDMLYLYNRDNSLDGLKQQLAELPFRIDSLTQVTALCDIITTNENDCFVLEEQLAD
ncbi:MAG: hypothetical protein ACI4WG_04510 [Erysipelotrichaceae bacterium]